MAPPINLLPWRQMRQRRCLRFWALMLAGALLLIAVSLAAARCGQRQSQALAQIRHQGRVSCVAALAQREQARLLQQQRQARWQALQEARQRTQIWQARLLALATALPPQAWLTRLEVRDGFMTLEGRASHFSALAEVTAALHGLPFPTVAPGAVGKDAQGLWQFSYRLSGEAHDVGSD